MNTTYSVWPNHRPGRRHVTVRVHRRVLSSRSCLSVLTRFGVAEVMKAAATKPGAPEMRFHVLRHFYASVLIREALSVKVVQARLGHASAAVEPLDVYGHLWPDVDDRTRQAVDELLGGEIAEDWLRTEAGK